MVDNPVPPVERGKIIASLLSGAWRREPGSAPVSETELRLVAPILIRSGTAALAWRRIRDTPLTFSEPGAEIRAARRIQAAQAAIRLAQLQQVLGLPAVHDARPILIKGRAHGQLYPEPFVRHYTDIDLLVEPTHLETATRAAWAIVPPDPARAIPVDIQPTLKDLPERSWAELYRRSHLLALPVGEVRTLGHEDTLRLSCVHMLRHLGFHPLWLCDISALLESLPADFDWEYALTGEARRTEWMLAAIRLANQVLGARLDGCPVRHLPRAVPPWMIRAMLRWWGSETTYIYPWPRPRRIGPLVAGNPRDLPHAFADRWPDPLQAVGRFSWPITRFSGGTAQILDYAGRALIWGPRQLGFFPRKNHD